MSAPPVQDSILDSGWGDGPSMGGGGMPAGAPGMYAPSPMMQGGAFMAPSPGMMQPMGGGMMGGGLGGGMMGGDMMGGGLMQPQMIQNMHPMMQPMQGMGPMGAMGPGGMGPGGMGSGPAGYGGAVGMAPQAQSSHMMMGGYPQGPAAAGYTAQPAVLHYGGHAPMEAPMAQDMMMHQRGHGVGGMHLPPAQHGGMGMGAAPSTRSDAGYSHAAADSTESRMSARVRPAALCGDRGGVGLSSPMPPRHRNRKRRRPRSATPSRTAEALSNAEQHRGAGATGPHGTLPHDRGRTVRRVSSHGRCGPLPGQGPDRSSYACRPATGGAPFRRCSSDLWRRSCSVAGVASGTLRLFWPSCPGNAQSTGSSGVMMPSDGALWAARPGTPGGGNSASHRSAGRVLRSREQSCSFVCYGCVRGPKPPHDLRTASVRSAVWKTEVYGRSAAGLEVVGKPPLAGRRQSTAAVPRAASGSKFRSLHAAISTGRQTRPPSVGTHSAGGGGVGRSGRQKAATRRDMRSCPGPDGMSHRGGSLFHTRPGNAIARDLRGLPPPPTPPKCSSQCWSRQTPAWTRRVHLDAPGHRHGQQPVSGTANPRSSQTGQVIRGLR